MNYAMIGKLILKDWHFGRPFVVACTGAGLAMLLVVAALISTSNAVVRVVAVVLFYCVLNALIWVPVLSVVLERRDQTLPFLISLPMTIKEYTAGKIASSLILFLVPWTVLTLAAIGFIGTSDYMSNSYIPLTLIIQTQLFALFCLVLGVALVSESGGITQGVGVFGNLIYWFSFGFIGVAPGFGINQDPAAVWNSPVSYMLPGQIVLIPVLLGLTFRLQSYKRDFL
jgi:ABC-type Na+ efflux pump permease subunit